MRETLKLMRRFPGFASDGWKLTKQSLKLELLCSESGNTRLESKMCSEFAGDGLEWVRRCLESGSERLELSLMYLGYAIQCMYLARCVAELA